MKVGELKKMLVDVDDELEILISSNNSGQQETTFLHKQDVGLMSYTDCFYDEEYNLVDGSYEDAVEGIKIGYHELSDELLARGITEENIYTKKCLVIG